MSRIWRYVLATDRGYAPCVDEGVLTLCTCKPRIRSGAAVGDWVIGFMPKRFGAGRVAWAGCVREILSLGDYGEQYAGRRDAIYRRTGWHPDGREDLEHYGGSYHNSAKSIATDVRGRCALIFDPFWYWGKNAPEAPQKLAKLAHYYIGESTRSSTRTAIEQLRVWLSGWRPGVHGTPRDGLPRACRRDRSLQRGCRS
jgi:hypothetical protein